MRISGWGFRRSLTEYILQVLSRGSLLGDVQSEAIVRVYHDLVVVIRRGGERKREKKERDRHLSLGIRERKAPVRDGTTDRIKKERDREKERRSRVLVNIRGCFGKSYTHRNIVLS